MMARRKYGPTYSPREWIWIGITIAVLLAGWVIVLTF